MTAQMTQAQLMQFVTETKTVIRTAARAFYIDDRIKELVAEGWSVLTPPTPNDNHTHFHAVLVKYDQNYITMMNKTTEMVIRQLSAV